MDKFPSAGATDTPRQGDTQVLWPQDPRALAGRHVGGLGGWGLESQAISEPSLKLQPVWAKSKRLLIL